ncbi:hypothetical protein J0895_07130 [Phormidium pseudopriestleyi FRX01]|uniref:Tic20 family protein Ycf60 n=1 Tax=Phormidium pseudopriestleyi FRX01 TaxID=1759528 RepID=A0ABS3FP64_9CYAN|nr:Tic20 family protein [Phormidium pseudopriestleyi]MBO0348875.1 hypothetical protein [Phormidium pseudopriestleyi FRX01]
MSWNSSTTVPDRIFASLPYLLPLIVGVQFGIFLFREFPFLSILFVPLQPLMSLYYGIPFAGLIIFFVLLFAVVRNDNISRFIRFNTMQAILLNIILAITGLVVQLLGKALPALAVQTLFNMLFLGTVAAVGYSVVQSLLGRYAEIPTISEAVHMQVR